MWYCYLLSTFICFFFASICISSADKKYKEKRKARPHADALVDLPIFMNAAFGAAYAVIGLVCFINLMWVINTGHAIPLPPS